MAVGLAPDIPDFRLRFLQWVEVYHPIEDQRMECPPIGVAFFFRRNRAMQSELGAQGFLLAVGGGHAQVYVLVPLRDRERDALVEVVFVVALGSGTSRRPVCSRRRAFRT